MQKCRHELVEETVEMIRPEHDGEIGMESVQGGRRFVQLVEKLRLNALLGLFDTSDAINGRCEQQISWTAMFRSP
jgi:hypothetical protein